MKKVFALILALVLLCAALPAMAVDAPQGLFAGKFKAGSQIFDCQQDWVTEYTKFKASYLQEPYGGTSGRYQFTSAQLDGKYFMFKEGTPGSEPIDLYLFNDDGTPAATITNLVGNDGYVNSGKIAVIADEGLVYLANKNDLGYFIPNGAGYSYNSGSHILHTNIKSTDAGDNITSDYLKGLYISTTPLAAGQVAVHYEANGGTPAPADAAVNIGSGTTAPTVNKTGYSLEGWYKASDFSGAPWNFATDTFSSPTTLYAKWTGGSATSSSSGGQTTYVGARSGGILTIHADCAKFVRVTVDGATLVRDRDFTLRCGSTIVELTPAYLASLASGTHTMRVQFTDGYYEDAFTVPLGAESSEVDLPKTGDSPSAFVALGAAMLATALLLMKRRAA